MSEYAPQPLPPKTRLPEPNPETRKAHRRQVLRQITLPLGAMLLLVSAVVAATALYGVGELERWGQIATLFVLLPAMALTLILIAVCVFMMVAIAQALRLLPPYARLAQNAIERVRRQTLSGANISVEPLLQIQSFLAMVDAVFGRGNHRGEA